LNLNEILASFDPKIEILSRDKTLLRTLVVQSGVALGIDQSSTTIRSSGIIGLNTRQLSELGLDFGILESHFENKILNVDNVQVMANLWEQLASYSGVPITFITAILDFSDDIPIDLQPQSPFVFLQNYLLTRVTISLEGNLHVKDPHLNNISTTNMNPLTNEMSADFINVHKILVCVDDNDILQKKI